MMTLDEIALEVERRLTKRGLIEPPHDGRVAAVPDPRTIRYYTTLGLLDRPRIVEREARYERHHVLQLLAIKALQVSSLPLAAIQERLYGRSDAELEAIVDSIPRPRREIRTLVWREVVLEPGLRLMIEEGWSPKSDPAALEDRVRAALAALKRKD